MSDFALLLVYVVGVGVGALSMWLWVEASRPDRRRVVLRRLARLERRGRYP